MSCNVEEEDVGSSLLEGICHELLIRRGDKKDAEAEAGASTQQSVVTTTGESALNLAQGENWLRLVASLGTNSVLQDTQETAIGTIPFPTISSLSEIGTIDAPTEDCYICIDVDGPYVSVKDMRAPLSSQDSQDEVFDICIKRRKQRLEKIVELADSQDTGIEQEYHALEALERRQLRMLHPGDCIVIRNNSVGPGSDLVLEYHQYESRANGLEMADESQVVNDAGIAAAASGDTEASKPSDRLQTQPDPTPRLSDYQTAVESQPANKSEEENSETSFEDDEAEATQVFARSSTVLSTQSPEKQRDSDDETAMDVDANEKEHTFMTPAGRESELVAQPQGRGTGGLAAEIERNMELTTQSISSRDNTDEENGEQRDGNRMSAIAEQEESAKVGHENEEAEDTTKSSASADDNVDVPRSQASTTLDDTQRAESSDDDDDDVTENREEDADSDSDALLDAEDIKDASIDVPETPNKADSVSKIDATIEKMAEAGKEQQSNEKDETKASVGDEECSDSSSITEIEGDTPKPKLKESAGITTSKSQDEVAETAGEPAPPALDDDDVTEPGDLISPRKGLVTVPARGKSGNDESPSTEQNDTEEVEPDALTETTDSDAPKHPANEDRTATDKVVEEAGTNKIPPKPVFDRNARKVIEWESREDKSLPESVEANQAETKVEEAVVAETDLGKSPSTDSSPPKECLSHTEETEVTNNVSSSANREVATEFVETTESLLPLSKETAPMVNTQTDKAEIKERGETKSSVADEHPIPEEAPVESSGFAMEATTTNNADAVGKENKQTVPLNTPLDQKATADELSAPTENDHADNNKESKQEELADDNEASSTVDSEKMAEAEAPSRPTRDSRKKAAPSQADGDDKEEDEDAVRPPAKKRARSTRTKAKSEIKKEPEHDASLGTPAKKIATRAARGSARKRTRGARTPTSGDETVRVLMTGVAEGAKEKKVSKRQTICIWYHFQSMVFSLIPSCVFVDDYFNWGRLD